MRRQRLGLDDEANRVVWHFQGDRSNHRRQRLGHGAAHSEGRVTSHLYSQRQQGTSTVEVWRPSGSLGRTTVGVATATQDDERRDTSRPVWQQLNNKTATTGPWCGQATPDAATKNKQKNSPTNRLKKKRKGCHGCAKRINTAPPPAVRPATGGSPPTGGCKTRPPASRPSPPLASYPPARGAAAGSAAQSPWPRRRGRRPLGVGG